MENSEKFKKGFSILEVIIYIALFICIISLLHVWIAKIFQQFHQVQHANAHYAQLWTVHELLSRDLRAAPTELSKWKRIETHFIVWHSNSKLSHVPLESDIGWYIEKENLYRITGIYDAQSHAWSHQMKSLIARGITQYSFGAQLREDEILGFAISLVSQHGNHMVPMAWKIFSNNRKINETHYDNR